MTADIINIHAPQNSRRVLLGRKMTTWIKGLLCFVFAVAAAVSLYAFLRGHSPSRVMSDSVEGQDKAVATAMTAVQNAQITFQKKRLGWTDLMFAADECRSEDVKALLDDGANPNAADNNGWTALMRVALQCAYPGREAYLGKLAHAVSDPNLDLAAAAELIKQEPQLSPGSGDIVKMLLAAGANPNAADNKGGTALMWAMGGDNLEALKILLNAGANPNAADNNGETALMAAAAAAENLEALKTLLAAGANPNAANNHGTKVLIIVAHYFEDPEAFKVLLEAGANPNSRSKNGYTALMVAAGTPMSRHPEVAKVLLDAGANPNATNDAGKTALMAAAGGGYDTPNVNFVNPEFAKALLDAGANPNAADNGGRTALMHAANCDSDRTCEDKDVEIFKVLLDAGANPTMADNDGKTALDFAKERGKDEIARLLESAQEK